MLRSYVTVQWYPKGTPLHTFFKIFPVQVFQNTIIIASMMKFSRVMSYTPYSCVLTTIWLYQKQILEFFRNKIIGTKKSEISLSILDF